jgi:hypothetical protein
MTDTLCSCRQWATHYDVPEDLVFAIVADQFMSERTGIPPLEAEHFAQMANDMLTEELILFYEETKARLALLLPCTAPEGELERKSPTGQDDGG